MYRYVILAVALVALGEAAKDFKCPTVVGKYPFDEAKFAGDWYVVASLPKSADEADKKCAKASFNTLRTGSDTTMTMQYTCKQDDKFHKGEGFAQAYKSEKSSMFYGVFKKEGETKWSGIYKQAIIATDYENYAVSISCKPKFDEATKTFSRSLYAGIYGRKTTLPEETLKTLKNILTGYDINYADIKIMDHTDCDAKLKI